MCGLKNQALHERWGNNELFVFFLTSFQKWEGICPEKKALNPDLSLGLFEEFLFRKCEMHRKCCRQMRAGYALLPLITNCSVAPISAILYGFVITPLNPYALKSDIIGPVE